MINGKKLTNDILLPLLLKSYRHYIGLMIQIKQKKSLMPRLSNYRPNLFSYFPTLLAPTVN